MIINKSTFLGWGLIASLFKLNVGLPILMMLSSFSLKKVNLPAEHRLIFLLLIVKVCWVLGVQLYFDSRTLYFVLQVIFPDIIMLLMMFLAINHRQLLSLFKPLVILFVIDLGVNLIIIFTGSDPFGRVVDIRPDDIMPRLGGVFNHSFSSINISFVALIISLFLRSKLLFILSIMSLCMTGSLRGPLVAISSLIIMFFIYNRFSKKSILIFLTSFVVSVFLLTVYSAVNASYEDGNVLRVFAWVTSIEHIKNNPVFGTHIFETADFDAMSFEVIRNHGIAESSYLQLALDFGVIPSTISLIVFYLLFNNAYKVYLLHMDSSKAYSVLIMTLCILVDSFYGSLFGSAYTAFFVSVLCISYSRNFRVGR